MTEVSTSSDLLVFPINTDTFGNPVLEIQASGIPCIVSYEEGPQENQILGKTGLGRKANSFEVLQDEMEQSSRSPARCKAMG